MDELSRVAIVGIVFGSILGIVLLAVGIPLYFRSKRDNAVFATIKFMTERDRVVAPELIQALIQERQSPQSDLRRGVILLAVSVAIMIFSVLDGGGRQLFGIAAFPGLIGIAYIGFYFFQDEASKTGIIARSE